MNGEKDQKDQKNRRSFYQKDHDLFDLFLGS